MTELAALLNQNREEIVAEAGEACARAHLAHYGSGPGEQTRTRLRSLVEVVIRGCESNCLDEARSYGEFIGLDRRARGFGLDEVQVAVNAAEAAVWRLVLCRVEAAQQGPALGRVSTILGALKDSMARRYVQPLPSVSLGSLELAALFAGTEANGPVRQPATAPIG